MEQRYKDMLLHICTIAPVANVNYSIHTDGFYVSAPGLEIGGDGLLSGIGSGHRSTPEEAIEAAFESLTAVQAPMYIVTRAYSSDRRHYRWNGVAFAEIVVDIVRSR